MLHFVIALVPDISFLLQDQYNFSQEIERKRALSMVLSQTKQQERKDAEVNIILWHLLFTQ